MKVYHLHIYNGNVQQNPLCAAYCHLESSHLSPVLAYDFLSRCKFSTPTMRSINRLYAQNPVFEIVHDESVNVYPHMYNGNVQQNPLCVESCLTKGFAISPRFSPTIFDPDANSVLLRAYLCTAVDSMRGKPCVRNCSREREGLYNGNVQHNSLCAASCVTKDIPISPRFPPTFFHRRANPAPYSAQFLIHSMTNGCTLQIRRSQRSQYVCVCVCVCVFFPFILDIKFVGRTSRGHTRGRSHTISYPPSFCGACLKFSREKDSAIPFSRRP